MSYTGIPNSYLDQCEIIFKHTTVWFKNNLVPFNGTAVTQYLISKPVTLSDPLLTFPEFSANYAEPFPLCVRIVVAFFEKHQTEGVVS